jgi:hypothetical protein
MLNSAELTGEKAIRPAYEWKNPERGKYKHFLSRLVK